MRRSTQPIQSQEQIDSATVIRALVGSWQLAEGQPLARVLELFRAYFAMFPNDATAHSDMLPALATVLGRVALNSRASMTTFGQAMWVPLLAFWNKKERPAKEALIISLRHLFDFVGLEIDGEDERIAQIDRLTRLVKLIDSDADVRTGVSMLAVDDLRLDLRDPGSGQLRAFETNTFCAAPTFSAANALSWATLELQADALCQLHVLSEVVHDLPKSMRTPDPMAAFLSSLSVPGSADRRHWRLQILLFLIERHWSALHQSLRVDALSALTTFLAHDDPECQSWAFLCFAAVARAPGDAQPPVEWEVVWNHAIRRASVAAVCRAACHASLALLLGDAGKVSTQRVLADIEALAKDITIQGPTFPSDAVCAFLCRCLQVASQDARLYKMQLEDQVLAWLADAWALRRQPWAVHDLLALLEAVCGLGRRSALPGERALPDCAIAEACVMAQRTRRVREFMLHARLDADAAPAAPAPPPALAPKDDLRAPRTRERKASAFLLKTLEAADPAGAQTAAHVRTALDLAVLALCFESSLELNGTRPTRRVVQAACKVFEAVRTGGADWWLWTDVERAAVMRGIDPLVRVGDDAEDEPGWDVLVQPGKRSGIEIHKLSVLRSAPATAERVKARRTLQRAVWRSADVQDEFTEFSRFLRGFLHRFIFPNSGALAASAADDMDLDTEFPHARSAAVPTSRSVRSTLVALLSPTKAFASSLVMVLATAPMLQSDVVSPTRDKDLIELILSCDGLKFQHLATTLCLSVRRGALHLGTTELNRLLESVANHLEHYECGKNEDIIVAAIALLECSIGVWYPLPEESPVINTVRDICAFLTKTLRHRQWRVRDCWTSFCARCLDVDPTERFWRSYAWNEECAPYAIPFDAVVDLMSDSNVLVRLRAALVSSRLFELQPQGYDVVPFYTNVLLRQLTSDVHHYESMITRILALANYMIVNSAVRRGPFWHLLEPLPLQAHSGQGSPGQRYRAHIQVVLEAVARRLGMERLSTLFEAYSLQLAHSFLSVAGKDFFSVPPQVLGYGGRRELAEATFATAAPALLLGAGGAQFEELGRQAFSHYCDALNKTPQRGRVECFSSCVGLAVIFWIDGQFGQAGGVSLTDDQSNALADVVLTHARACEADDPEKFVVNSLDGIVSALLRTLGDIDFRENGEIVQQLKTCSDGDSVIKTFVQLMRYRIANDFEMHAVNMPYTRTLTVIRALEWFKSHVRGVDSDATVYHVLHQLFAAVSQTPLINEKMRLMHGICLWISFNCRKFGKSLALLRTVILGATVLLANPDLAHFSQSILGWAFSVYRSLPREAADPIFPDAFSRMGATAYSFACDHADQSLQALGTQLLDWFELQLASLAKKQHLRGQVAVILHLWPRQPRAELGALSVGHDHVDTISAVLVDSKLTSNKFKLVGRMRDFAQDGTYSTSRFATEDFWRIKSCMPEVDHLLDEDIDAFLDLLFASHAQLISVTEQTSASVSIAYRHRAAVVQHRSASPSPKSIIILALLSMLSSESLLTVHVAYSTLRLVVPLRPANDKLPADSREEIAFFSEFVPSPRESRNRELSQALTDAAYMSMLRDFREWIRAVSVLLADSLATQDKFWGQLVPLLQRDVPFAEDLFPILVHSVLSQDRLQASGAGASAADILSEYFSRVLRDGSSDTLCIRSIIRAVLHLRSFIPPGTTSAAADVRANELWLTIDFEQLSRGAIACGAYTTALLFLELSIEFARTSPAASLPEDVLYEIYSRIDEPDGFYGIKSRDTLNFLIRRFHHEREWGKVLHFHGAEFEGAVDRSASGGILDSLHAFGFDNLAMSVLQSGSTSLATSEPELGFRVGWRTDSWDLPDPPSNAHPQVSLYQALRAIHRGRDEQAADATIRSAVRREISRLRQTGNENLQQIREIAQSLMCLREIRRWRGAPVQTLLADKQSSPEAWYEISTISPQFDFQDLETILATRMSLLRSVLHREQRDQIGDAPTLFAQCLLGLETRCLIRVSEASRQSRHTQIALNAIVRAQQLEKSHRHLSFDVAQEFSSVLWMQKEQKVAIEYLRDLLQQDPDFATPTQDLALNKQKALLLARIGGWASEARMQKPVDIREQYFDPATNLLVVHHYSQASEDTADPDHATIFHRCAIFAEHHYHTILESSEVAQLMVYRKRKEDERKKLQRQVNSGNAGEAATVQLRKTNALLTQDSAQLQLHESARDAFRDQAVEMFSRCLRASDEFDDDAIIRLCSIWTANFQLGNEDAFHDVVQAALFRVPSRKFVFLAHQLSARLSKDTDVKKSQVNLQSLLLRICSEHPFHSMYQVFSLQRAADPDAPTRRRASTSSQVAPALQARANAAQELTNKVLESSELTSQRALDIQRLCFACLEWAQYPLKGRTDIVTAKDKTIPSHLQICKVQNVRVPVTTIQTPVDPLLRYDNIVYIVRYSPSFATAGGINLPKISDCEGSDGLKYKQLFKGEGNDDLRQDAVMEQVFELCNKVLKRDREAAKRKLFIRTYKVIPLSPKAGMLEFVTNTSPLGEWLTRAHTRYNGPEMSVKDVQGALKAIHNGPYSVADKNKRLLDAFQKIRTKVRPVMRFFFRERHKDPMAWFAMRLNYARSAATTSIIGHVLGLGDRHVSNILIDKTTGDLVHIDLGIAFEQGKLLPVPETVPFRLTADMVDGLGTTGPEGVFRRCAEHTLRVLHDGNEVIKLVLEVFKHDPLHMWYAAVKLNKAQPDSVPQSDRFGIGINADSNPEVEAADRALSTVARKLDRSLSVEYTVNELITTAMDPANLSRIFCGWNPQF
ncbi:hypothetical protein AURDEDRAFT_184314 [Auricularia subglabra TFB-10046 SS5]|nr:hypothetical protein AURDEDRAFT_184314 [Auricularia subglabra TFB-10046 SS5]